MEPNFNNLPQAVAQLSDELKEIKQLIIENKQSPQPDPDRWFSIDELCEYLPGHPARCTIYGWVHTRTVPHKKFGKRLAFLKSEIDLWIKHKGRKTVLEIEAEADTYIRNVKKKRG